ncbi:MAG TPA: phosphohistidine phosphatase SixA [Magnetospirillaceae bacterium]|nr:phosphohistidine phosphatase SixA [Magnetospirillaceae bacterium]
MDAALIVRRIRGDDMRVYFLRHGEAADRTGWAGMDADRPLTESGEKELRAVAKKLARMGLAVEAIRSSPLARALGTASIVARGLGLDTIVATDDRLAPGFDTASFRAILAERPRCASLMLVGHEPDLSHVVAELTGGTSVEMKKAGLARVDFSMETGAGVLVWLLPPKVLMAEG